MAYMAKIGARQEFAQLSDLGRLENAHWEKKMNGKSPFGDGTGYIVFFTSLISLT